MRRRPPIAVVTTPTGGATGARRSRAARPAASGSTAPVAPITDGTRVSPLRQRDAAGKRGTTYGRISLDRVSGSAVIGRQDGRATVSRGACAMEITGIISALIIGIIIGALGRLVVPGRQRIPLWLTMVIGIVAALIGTAIASVLGVADTRGIDWIELAIQVALAAVGVSLAAGSYGRRGGR